MPAAAAAAIACMVTSDDEPLPPPLPLPPPNEGEIEEEEVGVFGANTFMTPTCIVGCCEPRSLPPPPKRRVKFSSRFMSSSLKNFSSASWRCTISACCA